MAVPHSAFRLPRFSGWPARSRAPCYCTKCTKPLSSAITAVDYSAAQSVRGLLQKLAAGSVTVVFGRVSSYLLSDMDRHGITAAVGPSRIFSTLHEALEYAHANRGAHEAHG